MCPLNIGTTSGDYTAPVLNGIFLAVIEQKKVLTRYSTRLSKGLVFEI